MNQPLLFRGATVVLETGPVVADVLVKDGRIAEVGTSWESDAQTFDARGLHLLPGAIDTQVHFRDPGLTHKEDLSTGSAAAACGGVTSFCEMPNTSPNTDTAERLAQKVAAAHEKSWVDFAFYLGATRENVFHLGEWETLPGCVGVKVFLGSSTGNLLVDDDEVLAAILRAGRKRIAFHSEDEARLKERRPLAEGQTVLAHPVWRDEETAVRSTKKLLQLAREARRKVHVLHVTTAGELPLLRDARDVATFEVTPQHLTLSAPECYEKLGTFAQMNPPIRDATHQHALWQAVTSGLVDVLGSDHAPHTRDEKAKPYPQSPSGMPGVQTMLPLMLTHAAAGKLTLTRVVELLSWGPARVCDIVGKGKIAKGYDADFALVDLKREYVFDNADMKTKCGWTPFHGMKAVGKVVGTMVRGQWVMRDGQLMGVPSGQPLKFFS